MLVCHGARPLNPLRNMHSSVVTTNSMMEMPLFSSSMPSVQGPSILCEWSNDQTQMVVPTRTVCPPGTFSSMKGDRPSLFYPDPVVRRGRLGGRTVLCPTSCPDDIGGGGQGKGHKTAPHYDRSHVNHGIPLLFSSPVGFS